ncbi:MAG: hypothetical protein ACTHYR_08525, partial [Brachybacterium sp.]
MNANATPHSPVQDDSEDLSPSTEPTWIEVGSPKRRTTPPAWSDEVAHDAWEATGSADEPALSAAPARFELVDAAASADEV